MILLTTIDTVPTYNFHVIGLLIMVSPNFNYNLFNILLVFQMVR